MSSPFPYVVNQLAQGLAYAGQFGAQIRRSAATLASDQAGQSFQPIPDLYALNERYYSNEVYERYDAREVMAKAWFGLPRHLRPLLSLAKPAVDWWPGHVYPGTWTITGQPASSGKPNRIPYDTDTPEEIRLAAQQAFTWGGWGGDLLVYVRTGAKLGDVFAEVEVDYLRGKVYPKLTHPRWVKDLVWNPAGDLIEFRLAIPQYDEERRKTYLWGKRVTKEWITTYYDDQPHGFDGQPAVVPNPWGFVPAIWVQHANTGGQHGASVIDGLHPVIDELNSLQSSVDDYILKFANQHIIVSSDDPKGFKAQLDAQVAGGPTYRQTDPYAQRQRISVLPAPPNVSVHRVLENLGLGESSAHFDRIVQALERNLPELVLSERLMKMRQVTAPGALALVQDVQHKFDEACGNYDQGIVKLVQMCCAIGGELANSLAWGLKSQLSPQQQKFLPFSLASFDRDELSVSLRPRDLLPPTLTELAAEAAAVEGIRTPWGFHHVGLPDEDIYGVDPATGEALAPAEPAGILDDLKATQPPAGAAVAAATLPPPMPEMPDIP